MFRGASLLAVASARIPGGQGRAWFSVAVTDEELLAVVHEAVNAVVASFDGHDDWWRIQPPYRGFRMLGSLR